MLCFYCFRRDTFARCHVNNEKPWFIGLELRDYTTQFSRNYEETIMRIPIKQPGFHEMSCQFFFRGSRCFSGPGGRSSIQLQVCLAAVRNNKIIWQWWQMEVLAKTQKMVTPRVYNVANHFVVILRHWMISFYICNHPKLSEFKCLINVIQRSWRESEVILTHPKSWRHT